MEYPVESRAHSGSSAGLITKRNPPANNMQEAIAAVGRVGADLDRLLSDLRNDPTNNQKFPSDSLPSVSLYEVLQVGPSQIHDHCSYAMQRINELREMLLG